MDFIKKHKIKLNGVDFTVKAMPAVFSVLQLLPASKLVLDIFLLSFFRNKFQMINELIERDITREIKEEEGSETGTLCSARFQRHLLRTNYSAHHNY